MRRVIYIISILIILGVGSCRSIRYVPVEKVKYDSIYITNHQRDSIYERDSIYIIVKGDTVYQYKDKLIYRDRIVNDTIYINHTDTTTEVIEVEKELNGWQKLKMDVGGIAIGVVSSIILAAVIWLIIRIKK